MKENPIEEVFYDEEEGFHYRVKSFTDDKVYDVEMNAYGLVKCSCPQFTYRYLKGREGVPKDSDEHCKHIKLVLDKIVNKSD